MAKLLIVGANGQLGRMMIEVAKAQTDWRIFSYTRRELDISDKEQVQEAFEEVQPDFCVNCAAYTAVDKAEKEADVALKINGTSAGRLAQQAKANHCRFVHVSTDYVYADRYNRPLLETDDTDPINTYGRSKLAGERAVLESGADALIVRTSWVYSEWGHNFLLSMLRLGRERDHLRIVYDQVGAPTYARDLAGAVVALLQQEAAPGIYNFANAGTTSWYDFCLAIHLAARIENCRVSPILTQQYPTPARRPTYSLMDTTKIKGVIGDIRHWREAMVDCIGRV